MTTDAIYLTAHQSLVRLLDDIRAESSEDISSRLHTAIIFAEEMKDAYLRASGGRETQVSRLDAHEPSPFLDVLRRCEVLKEIGVSMPDQVLFAKSEGLKEVDLVRLVRALRGVGLSEALVVVSDVRESGSVKRTV